MTKNNKIIIGITGTLGAGKGTIVEYLKTKGFEHYSVRAYLIEEINKRQLPVTIENLAKVGNDLRSKHGASYIMEELYKKAQNLDTNVIIESIRTTGEVEGLKKLGTFYLIAVDAPLEIRYQRVLSRQGDNADIMSFEEFVKQENKQMNNLDPEQLNLAGCIKIADFKLTNNGTKEELWHQVDKVLEQIK